jgi:hypothetical protein
MPVTFEGPLPEDDPIFSGGPMFVFKRPLDEASDNDNVDLDDPEIPSVQSEVEHEVVDEHGI